jgi:hypothetical protein
MAPSTRGTVGRLVAEFAVIVLGVLVALAADRWNQSRQDRSASIDFARRLEIELTADSVRFHNQAEQANQAAAQCLSLLHLLSGSGVEAQAPRLYQDCVIGAPLAYAGGSTFQEIRNTGALHLLSPESRQALFDYYGLLDALLLRLRDFRNVGWVPLSEAAFGTGAWLPEGSLTAEEWLARLRAYPDIEERVNRAIGWQRTTAGALGGWEPVLGQLLTTVRGGY